jgi:maleylacetoacetate isomerase
LINAADSHPLIVPRVRRYLTDVLKVSDEERLAWIQHWLGAGLQAIETLLAEHSASGVFCHGDPQQRADDVRLKPTSRIESLSLITLI